MVTVKAKKAMRELMKYLNELRKEGWFVETFRCDEMPTVGRELVTISMMRDYDPKEEMLTAEEKEALNKGMKEAVQQPLETNKEEEKDKVVVKNADQEKENSEQ